MSRHYSTRDFFRQMPNALLGRYFGRRGLLADVNFSALKDAQPDELFEAWLALPHAQRNAMESEFRGIFEMSCEKGFRAVLDEAKWQLRGDPAGLNALIEKLAAAPNHFERAMVTFLDQPALWPVASLFYHADSLPYWRKRKNLPKMTAATDEASLGQLAGSIRDYFHRTEGRGNNCTVEPYRRGDLDYFFAYPEDYSQQAVEWVDGKFARRPHNPAFEVIFVYAQKDGSLDLNVKGASKAIEPLQAMFARTILKTPDLPPDPKDGRVYDLDPLQEKRFDFVFDAATGIQSVVIRKLRLSSKVRKGDRLTLEADPTGNPHAIHDLLAEIGKSTPLRLFNVTQVELVASVATDPGKPPKAVAFKITHPNSCSLKYDELDLKLRDMLHASGIEPKEPGEDLEVVDQGRAP